MRGIGWAEIISAPNINHNNGAFVRSKVADGFASLVLLEELLAEQRATEYPTRPADAPAWARAFSVGGYGRPPFVLPVSLLRELVARQAELILTVVS